MADTSLIFKKLTIALQLILVKNFYITGNENQANCSYTCRYEVVVGRSLQKGVLFCYFLTDVKKLQCCCQRSLL